MIFKVFMCVRIDLERTNVIYFFKIGSTNNPEKNLEERFFYVLLHREKIGIMEEIGDWLYIIVIIIAGIASFISSMRKKTQQTSVQNSPREISMDAEEDDFWNEHMPQREVKPVFAVQPISRSFQTVDQQYKKYVNVFQEGQPVQPSEEPLLVDTVEEYPVITISDLPSDTDDWRKAFVYKEIFNRKYNT